MLWSWYPRIFKYHFHTFSIPFQYSI